MKKILSVLLCAILMFMLTIGASAASPASDASEIENTITEYYNISYDSWLSGKYQDLSDYLYLESNQSYNKITTLKECILRWEHALEQDNFVDPRKRLDITFEFGELQENSDGTVNIVVYLEGDHSEAYPYFVNFGRNEFTLVLDNNLWKISSHEYDGLSLYEYPDTTKVEFDASKVLNEIDTSNSTDISIETNSLEENVEPCGYPYTSYAYSSSRAVEYANDFCENRNTYFYKANEDCTNFVSQCVSYGFGSSTSYTSSSSYRMVSGASYTSGWYASSGGGSAAWESVTSHWNYMVSAKTNTTGPRVSQITASSLGNGCVIQIDHTSDGTYDHSVICVDASTQKIAQHSDNRFRFLYDIGGTKRFYKPTSFRVY